MYFNKGDLVTIVDDFGYGPRRVEAIIYSQNHRRALHLTGDAAETHGITQYDFHLTDGWTDPYADDLIEMLDLRRVVL